MIYDHEAAGDRRVVIFLCVFIKCSSSSRLSQESAALFEQQASYLDDNLTNWDDCVWHECGHKKLPHIYSVCI